MLHFLDGNPQSNKLGLMMHLPNYCKKYVEFIEESLKVPVKWIGVGPARESMATKP